MPLPRWLAHINERVFNPMEVSRCARPVLIHTGRSSGEIYWTPFDAHRLPDGYLFIPLYGPRTDWVERPGRVGGTAVPRRPRDRAAVPALGEEEGHLAPGAHNHQFLSGHLERVRVAAHGHPPTGSEP